MSRRLIYAELEDLRARCRAGGEHALVAGKMQHLTWAAREIGYGEAELRGTWPLLRWPGGGICHLVWAGTGVEGLRGLRLDSIVVLLSDGLADGVWGMAATRLNAGGRIYGLLL